MNLRYLPLSCVAATLACSILSVSEARAQDSKTDDVEELLRGPVHEAFAATVSFDPQPGILVDVAPPDVIEEVPPEQRPDGDNVAWIPGYWGWDEDENDFIWISGVWRNLPPGRQWVPGYWYDTNNQWQWISGYWEDEAVEEVRYLPEPPESIEEGPSVEAPSSNHVWTPGVWVYRENRYAWRPGYWDVARENWAWTPAHYRWSPGGYIFVDGYWDYVVPRRGVVFAPVRFHRHVYRQPDYFYRPALVVALEVFTDHLFVRPSYQHYYFGDYYEPRYRDRGFFASFSYHREPFGYDPIFVHNRWMHRGDRNWERRRLETFEYYRAHADARPPRTWAALRARPEGQRRASRDDFEYAQPLDRYVQRREGERRFVKVDEQTRERFVKQRQAVREFRRERQKAETETRVAGEETKRDRVRSQRLGKSPLVAKKVADLKGEDAPPQRRASKDSELKDRETAIREAKRNRSEGRDRSRRPEEDRSRRPEEDRSRRPEEDRSRRPEEDRSRRPEEDRSRRPEEDRSRRPEEDRSRRPEEDRSRRPEEDRSRRPEEDRSRRPEEERSRRPEEERSRRPEEDRSRRPEEDRSRRPEEDRSRRNNNGRAANDGDSARERTRERSSGTKRERRNQSKDETEEKEDGTE